MNLLTKRPHIIFLVFAVITFILGFNANGGIDINIHDTYFVMSNYHFATLISILFGIIGLIYWIVKKTNGNLSKRLNLIHVALTFGGIFLILILNVVIFGQIIFPINIISGIIRKRNKNSG